MRNVSQSPPTWHPPGEGVDSFRGSTGAYRDGKGAKAVPAGLDTPSFVVGRHRGAVTIFRSSTEHDAWIRRRRWPCYDNAFSNCARRSTIGTCPMTSGLRGRKELHKPDLEPRRGKLRQAQADL
jgi:hypothetical protein